MTKIFRQKNENNVCVQFVQMFECTMAAATQLHRAELLTVNAIYNNNNNNNNAYGLPVLPLPSVSRFGNKIKWIYIRQIYDISTWHAILNLNIDLNLYCVIDAARDFFFFFFFLILFVFLFSRDSTFSYCICNFCSVDCRVRYAYVCQLRTDT